MEKLVKNKGGYKWGERTAYIQCPCGILIKTYKSQQKRGRKYCSLKCYHTYNKPPSFWKDKKMPKNMREKMSIARKKQWDEGKMDNRKKLIGNLNHSKKLSVRKKISIANSGKNHWNWNGGITNKPYPKEFINTLRTLIKERDNYTCQTCGSREKLIVHHKDWNKQNSKLNNLITLCRSCHAYIHNGKRK